MHVLHMSEKHAILKVIWHDGLGCAQPNRGCSSRMPQVRKLTPAPCRLTCSVLQVLVRLVHALSTTALTQQVSALRFWLGNFGCKVSCASSVSRRTQRAAHMHHDEHLLSDTVRSDTATDRPLPPLSGATRGLDAMKGTYQTTLREQALKTTRSPHWLDERGK